MSIQATIELRFSLNQSYVNKDDFIYVIHVNYLQQLLKLSNRKNFI